MRKRSLPITAIILLTATCAWAEQDFYGIRIKNELWAKNLVWKTTPTANPADLEDGPILSHDITAEASLKETADGRIDFRVTVFNGTGGPVAADFYFRDFYITTRNGQKYPLIDNQDLSDLETIEPRSSATFTPSFGNLRLQNKDVMLIECSFDLGKTKIFLFPWAQKEVVTKLASPSAVMKEPRKGHSPKSPMVDKAEARGEQVGSKRTFLEWLSGKNRSKGSREAVAPGQPGPETQVEKRTIDAPVLAASVEKTRHVERPDQTSPAAMQAQPALSNRLDSAIKNFVYVPSDGTGKIVSAPVANAIKPSVAGAPRSEAHIISFNKAYNFVTLNLGSRDGLRSNMILSILRDGKIVAKARVKELREAVSAAALIPETIKAEIRTGDQVSLV